MSTVRGTLDLGYRCLIKCVRNDILPVTWLGQPLSHAHVEQMLAQGIDACGENGEYHTVVVDGPLFSHAVAVENRGLVFWTRLQLQICRWQMSLKTYPISIPLRYCASEILNSTCI